MNSTNLVWVLVLCFFYNGIAAETENNFKVPEVSLISLISSPLDYQGQYIRVVGFLQYDDKDCVLFLSKDDAKYNIFKNGFWLYPKKSVKDIEKMKDRFVIVQGIFDMKEKGAWQGYSGSFRSVDRMELCEEK